MSTPPTHDRYPYSPITERAVYDWPGGKRLAVYVALNLEWFAFGEGPGAELAHIAGKADSQVWFTTAGEIAKHAAALPTSMRRRCRQARCPKAWTRKRAAALRPSEPTASRNQRSINEKPRRLVGASQDAVYFWKYQRFRKFVDKTA